MPADILTRARALLAQRRAASDLEAVAHPDPLGDVLADLIAEVERLREIVDRRRLVWVRAEMPAGWHLCRPAEQRPHAALYTAFDRTHYTYARVGNTCRSGLVADPAARRALLAEWAQADGYDPDPIPEEAPR